jgi:hypothetical protein
MPSPGGTIDATDTPPIGGHTSPLCRRRPCLCLPISVCAARKFFGGCGASGAGVVAGPSIFWEVAVHARKHHQTRGTIFCYGMV